MKKPLLGLAALFACSGTIAQSTVTIFGGADMAVQRVSTDGASVTRLINGGSLTSRLGFRGVEDLGGGLSAGFWFEAGLNGDTGTGSTTSANNQTSVSSGGVVFNRRSTVSLMGRFGEIRLGRDASPVFWNQTAYDPFRTQGSAASINLTAGAGLGTAVGLGTVAAGRISNSIGYLLPLDLGGVYGQVLVGTGENLSNAGPTRNDGNYAGGRIGYAAGSAEVSAAGAKAVYAAGDQLFFNVGGSYDFRAVKLMAQFGTDERKGPVYSKARYWLVGATVPFGPGYVRASYGDTRITGSGSDASLAAIGYVYALSKRTQIYTALARIDNKGAGTLFNQGVAITRPGGNSVAYDVGLRHDF